MSTEFEKPDSRSVFTAGNGNLGGNIGSENQNLGVASVEAQEFGECSKQLVCKDDPIMDTHSNSETSRVRSLPQIPGFHVTGDWVDVKSSRGAEQRTTSIHHIISHTRMEIPATMARATHAHF